MRYDDTRLRDLLAAKYVLGSLHGAARKRFESLAIKRSDWQQAVDWWSARIHLLADTVPAIEPDKAVWQKIQSRLFNNLPAAKNSRFSWLQGWAWASTAIAATLAFIMVTHEPLKIAMPINTAQAPSQEPSQEPSKVISQVASTAKVALLSSADAKPGWLLALVKNKTGKPELRVTVMAGLATKNDKSFELWILPPDKSAPVSLGVLPQQGSQQVIVSEETANLLAESGLAVSLEPVGGSPTGGPTGAVLYQGKLVEI